MAGVRRVVKPPPPEGSSRDGPSLLSFFLGTLITMGAAISYLWVYNQTLMVSSELAGLQAELTDQTNTHRELLAAIDELSRLDRITSIARTQLQMHVPTAESLIVFVAQAEP